jgi:tetratricopeptide (TPR) repeat protein
MLAFTGVVWAGGARKSQSHRVAAATAAAAPSWTQDFDRNTTLGMQLETRTGSDAEFAEVRKLADQGLKAAREAVAKNPQSAEAQYALGSWLIYGYRAVTTQQTTTDATGEMHTATVRSVVRGLSDNPQDGLDALQKAAELAPNSGQYALDYAAALLDSERPDAAIGVLKTAWADKPELTPAEKMRAGLMLSDAYDSEEKPMDAREWLYSTLLLNPENVEIVRRMRLLDAAMPAPPQPIPPPEIAPSPIEQPSEAAPEAPASPPEEAAPAAPSEGGEEAAPSGNEGGGDEAAPDESGGDEAAPDEGTGSDTDGSIDEETLRQILGEEGG